MESRPAMVEKFFSSGVATPDAIVSALAPGKLALTVMVGKSTVGRSLTGRDLYPMMPKMRIPSMTRVVVTGRRMKSAEMFMIHLFFVRFNVTSFASLTATAPFSFPLCFPGQLSWIFHLHAGPRAEQELAFTHDLFAGGKALGDDRFAFVRAANRHRPNFNPLVFFDDENMLAFLADLDRFRGNDHGIPLCRQR